MSRDSNIHTARVYLAQSRHFTSRHRSFSFVLLEWAANCRRRIAADRHPDAGQIELFDMAITRMAK